MNAWLLRRFLNPPGFKKMKLIIFFFMINTYQAHRNWNWFSVNEPLHMFIRVTSVIITSVHIRYKPLLTHWGGVTHICVGKLTIIGSDNGLASVRRQAIIWTNDGLLLIGPLVTNFSEILIEILTFSFMKMHLKVSSVKRRPFCLGLNVLICHSSAASPVYKNTMWSSLCLQMP